MTNRELVIKALRGEFDDWAYEDMVINYHIDCPYFCGDSRCHCKNNSVGTKQTDEQCNACKREWLDAEVDE